ncbi:MAG: hypothetical protein AMJ69_09400 [Gammaproteobacteria bacterium SG8_47]|nr:MAG: hypothetical protein AMJ69_09400 [Gammaproteobacteria bacterium SG8_47]
MQAGHYSFLQQEGPLQRLSDADFALFEQTLIRALDETQDGEVLKWQGAESGAYGSFQPLESYEADGVRCRVMRMFSRAGDRQGEMVFDFCRQPDGAWKVAPRRRSR